MSAIVVDLDGTLFDHNHRMDLAKSRLWDEYHRKMVDDDVHADVRWLLDKMPAAVQVIFCTGRDEKWRLLTLECCRRAEIPAPDALLMRPNDDFTPDWKLKPKMLEEFFGTRQLVLDNVIVVLDDRDRVVEAWRNYGLPCWQVRQGAY